MYGSPGDFVEFMNHAQAIGMRVIVDLVVNHTSIDHAWFQEARRSARSKRRDWYVWSKTLPHNHTDGVVFPGTQHSTWAYDTKARAYYFHRFYDFQADLNTMNREVRDEITRVMGYWLELGVSGFRMDAVPFLIEKKGADVSNQQDFELLHELRDFLQWRSGEAILLAEANVPPEESASYFGDRGDHLQMMLNFPVNQRLFYALATGDLEPLKWALEATRDRPHAAQWVHFLRTHDELDLGRLTPGQRARVCAAFAPQKRMQLYNRGIRRRLAPMLGNDRRRLELAFSLLFSLPGTPMMLYGDEIGIGDNLSLPERECARTPMQWTADRHGGFTRGPKPIMPVINDRTYGYRRVNVAAQRGDVDSLLNWTERVLRTRKECPEIPWGHFTILPAPDSVLAMRYDWRNTSLVTLHNFTDSSARFRLDVDAPGGRCLADAFSGNLSRADRSGRHRITLEPYGHRWFRVGSVDNALDRTAG
jgi:maltose alpha-D-glucosyltransferase/alpha-amylase